MKFNLKKFAWLASAATYLAPLAAFAQPVGPVPPTGGLPAPVQSLTTVTGYLCVIISWTFVFLIILVVLFVLIGAFKFLTSGGDPEKAKAARQFLIYAAVALVVGLVARGVPQILSTFLAAGTIQGC